DHRQCVIQRKQHHHHRQHRAASPPKQKPPRTLGQPIIDQPQTRRHHQQRGQQHPENHLPPLRTILQDQPRNLFLRLPLGFRIGHSPIHLRRRQPPSPKSPQPCPARSRLLHHARFPWSSNGNQRSATRSTFTSFRVGRT